MLLVCTESVESLFVWYSAQPHPADAAHRGVAPGSDEGGKDRAQHLQNVKDRHCLGSATLLRGHNNTVHWAYRDRAAPPVCTTEAFSSLLLTVVSPAAHGSHVGRLPSSHIMGLGGI